MKRILALLSCIVLLLCFAGCESKKNDDGKINVVVTAFPHYDFVRQITKQIDNVEITMLISPGSEVHSYEPSPSDILAISNCDVFVYTGGESDVWAKGILDSVQNKDMTVISFMDICQDNHDEVNDGHGHVYDEHVWTSPSNAELIVTKISSVFSDVDPENKEKYQENLQDFTKKTGLSQVKHEFELLMKDCIRNEIIVADRFPFYHMAKEFGFEYISAYSGCSSSTEPSASVIAQLSDKVKSEKIPYVFTIEFSNQKIAKSVIEGTDAKILTLHSCHNVSKEDFDNGVTYCSLMLQNIENLRKALCE